jgi:hypothetical protein
MNYKEITVRTNTKTHRVFGKGYKNVKNHNDSLYNGVTLSKGAIYLVEKNTGFSSNKYDLLVRGYKKSNLTYIYETTFMVNSKDVVFLSSTGI